MPEPQTPTTSGRLNLDVCVLRSPELEAHAVLLAIRALEAGDRDAAMRGYRDLRAIRFVHPDSWSNLSALALALDDVDGARRHAGQALALARGHAGAWVNLGVACWHAGWRRDAAQAMARALSLAPGLEVAALNLNLMHQAVGQPARARAVLADALGRNPGAFRLQQAMAGVCRLLGDTEATRRHVLAALSSLLPTLAPAPMADDGPEPENEAAQARLLATMTDACDRLQAAGIGHHLVGGVVVGIVRQGRPFAGDKDVDIGVDFDADRDRIAVAFAEGYSYMRTPSGPEARRWCMGFTHAATGIGVDLFFKQRIGDILRINLGWPDALVFDLPAYRVEPFHWRGRAWPMPAPLEEYLVADYGEDWRMPTREAAGHVFDKRWLDSQVSSPSLAAESLPRAVNLGLMRLLAALQRGQWPKALALCHQILARESVGEAEAVRLHLLAAGIR
ncbi:MAG TPA: tetratricopeptide repeat protein [Thermomonas sp.]|nr:tetratricopeptide repeat protein [Thermomonas sp.]